MLNKFYCWNIGILKQRVDSIVSNSLQQGVFDELSEKWEDRLCEWQIFWKKMFAKFPLDNGILFWDGLGNKNATHLMLENVNMHNQILIHTEFSEVVTVWVKYITNHIEQCFYTALYTTEYPVNIKKNTYEDPLYCCTRLRCLWSARTMNTSIMLEIIYILFIFTL